MSIYYRLYQNKIKNSKSFGKYYARTIHTDTVNLDNIADTIQRNCTLKRSDVKACLTELVEVMRDALQSSSKVRINGLGMFKINVKSTAASDPGTFKGNNIVGYRVIFSPEHTVIKAKGTTTLPTVRPPVPASTATISLRASPQSVPLSSMVGLPVTRLRLTVERAAARTAPV